MNSPLSSFILLLFSINAATAHSSQAPNCNFEKPLEQTLHTRLENQKAAINSLKVLESGTGKGTIPVTALFSIAFDNAEIINSRIKELSQTTEESLELVPPYELWLKCAQNKNRPLVRSIIQNQVQIDHSKIQFLQLPSADREHFLAIYQTELTKSTSLEALADEANSSERRKKKCPRKTRHR